ncbi:MAG: hypothetical protein ACK5EA_03380, partial [Planctomycetaceae bacterium]
MEFGTEDVGTATDPGHSWPCQNQRLSRKSLQTNGGAATSTRGLGGHAAWPIANSDCEFIEEEESRDEWRR